MKWLWNVVLMVLLPLLLSEFLAWCPWLAERLIWRAGRFLPERHRARYTQEWLAELQTLQGRNLSMLVLAIGIFVQAPRTGHTLQNPLSGQRAWMCVVSLWAILILTLLPAPLVLFLGLRLLITATRVLRGLTRIVCRIRAARD